IDQSINRAKIGGPMATPTKRTELYKEVTKPRLSLPTDPVIKLLIQGKIRPAPTLLILRMTRNGMRLIKKASKLYDKVIKTNPKSEEHTSELQSRFDLV